MSNRIYAETSKTNSLEPKNGSDGIGKKPEVGDVWRDDVFKFHVLQVSENAVRVLYFNNLKPQTQTFSIKLFTSTKYLGKAKANINDLFEV